MKKDERNNSVSASSVRVLGLLAMICIGCAAMAPAVAAYGTVIDDQSVTVNTSFFKTIDGNATYWNYFFGICDTAGYGYNWTTGSYIDRKPITNLTINGQLYPEGGIPPTDYQWNIVNSLDEYATLYKKGLNGYVEPDESGMYYLWYGNDTAARSPLNGKSWLFPTMENATYVVRLNVTVV